MTRLLFVLLTVLACHPTAASPVPPQCELPDPKLTPGALCTERSEDFDGYRYAAHLAHCRRHVTEAVREQVARAYGVPRSEWWRYELDHLVPLACGGGNEPANLWMERRGASDEKDRVEEQIYVELRAGAITQREAVEKIKTWKPEGCR